MNYINCVPEDNFEVVLYCDASSASVNAVQYLRSYSHIKWKSLNSTYLNIIELFFPQF